MMRKIFRIELIIFLSAFALYSFLAVFAPSGIWNSPDETANAYFTERLAEGGGLAVLDAAVVRSGGLIHPRSISVSGGLLVPGSFLGMIVFYALFAALLGAGVLPFLTPFFSALAVIAFGAILKRFLPARAAAISMILLAAHPAFWYYSVRGLFHNVLFLDCLIFAAYFFICSPFESLDKKYGSKYGVGVISDGALGGMFFVLAASVRTFELVWAAPLAAALLWYGRKKINKAKLLTAFLIAAAAVGILFFLNYSIYGHIFSGGYKVSGGERTSLLALVFPFGFSLKNILWNGWYFGKAIFWWHTALAGASIIYLLSRRREYAGLKKYLLLIAAASLPLVLIYGSGRYLDTPDPHFATIGTSTVRYWLPLYAALIPFGGWFLDKLMARKSFWRAGAAAIVLASVIMSGRIVFWGRGEGAVFVLRELRRYESIRSEVISKTPETAIIISDRSDKIFFPARSVVSGTSSPEVLASLRNLSAIGPLYIYAIKMGEFDPRIDAYEKAGFALTGELEFGNERLYRLKSLK